MMPRATYRLQFNKDFTFGMAAAHASYFAALGISHIYASPILTARAGSMHGYDVIDHKTINPELGGESGFIDMAQALKEHGIGIILDIVPNHMAVGGADNAWWLDVIEKGRDSRYAAFFDIDFDIAEKLYLPVLGAPYGEILHSGELTLIWDERLGKFAAAYHHHRFPIRAEDSGDLRKDLARFDDPASLHELLERQNFRLAWWRTAGDEINWRRFFDVNELAALRIEQAEVFEAVHEVAFDLFTRGLIHGVRVDHVDGLTDPAAYCRKLRNRLNELAAAASRGRAYVIVEKILAPGEDIPRAWDIDGTTGYDFMNQVSAVQHDPSGEIPLTRAWAAIGGRDLDFDREECLARDEVLLTSFAAQFAAAAAAFHRVAQNNLETRDFTRAAIERGLMRILRFFRVYRTYATGIVGSPPAGAPFDRAILLAKAHAPDEGSVADFIASQFSNKYNADAVRRFNQLAAPLAAKSVEDTAFYRYGRLLSRNDVGFDPRAFAMTVDAFHRSVAERFYLDAMLTTATHDHKRGEDVRARLAVISEMPDLWLAGIAQWTELNAAIRPDGLAADDEYQLYQTLVGAWPFELYENDADRLDAFRQRIEGWCVKSLREAKLRSSWASPNEDYERKNLDFLRCLLDPRQSGAFLGQLRAFVDLIAAAGAVNGLGQLILRNTLPGIPDMYQGGEYWDFSLVDPDNRRAVDYEIRKASLEAPAGLDALAQTWRDGRIKQHLAAKLLRLRAEEPALFAEGDYTPLETRGTRANHLIAFSRSTGGQELIVIVPRHCGSILAGSRALTPPTDWWADTQVRLSHICAMDVRDILNDRISPPLAEAVDMRLMKAVPAIILVRGR